MHTVAAVADIYLSHDNKNTLSHGNTKSSKYFLHNTEKTFQDKYFFNAGKLATFSSTDNFRMIKKILR